MVNALVYLEIAKAALLTELKTLLNVDIIYYGSV